MPEPQSSAARARVKRMLVLLAAVLMLVAGVVQFVDDGNGWVSTLAGVCFATIYVAETRRSKREERRG
jgi:Flp pilus assembly protein TadB